MDIVTLLVQLVSGLIGGNAAGAASKKLNLGFWLNSLLGLFGGALGGQLTAALSNSSVVNAAGQLDLPGLVGAIAGSGIGGAVLTLLTGALKAWLSGEDHDRHEEP